MTRTRSVLRGLILASLAGVLVAVPGGPAAAGPPDAYLAAEIRGWVVDAETKQPLEGVHVVAQWILQTGLFDSRHSTRLHILETVTDAKGEYDLPPWGPKPRPVFTSLDASDPLLTFFKPGYRPLDRSNAGPHDNPLRTSRWHGKTIALEPFRGTTEEWIRVLQHVQITLDWGMPTDEFPQRVNDYWKRFPRIVLTILEQRRLLPDKVRYRVSDLQSWGMTEEQVRALVEIKGRPQ